MYIWNVYIFPLCTVELRVFVGSVQQSFNTFFLNFFYLVGAIAVDKW